MRARRPRLMPMVGLLAALSAPWPVGAQHPCPGSVSATTLRPVPHDATFNVAARTDSDQERALGNALLAELRRLGRRIADRPTHVVSWRGGLSRDDAAPTGGRGRETGSFRDSDDLRWMQDMPSSRRRGTPGTTRLNASVELRDRASGRVVWTAALSCERRGMDDGALIEALASAVAPLIGQSAAGRSF